MEQNLVELNQEALVSIALTAGRFDLRLSLESLFPPFDSVAAFRRPQHAPTLAFHPDEGRANCGEDGLVEFYRGVGTQLVQVHLPDNRGMRDYHLPLGAGHMEWPEEIPAIQAVASITRSLWKHSTMMLLRMIGGQLAAMR